MERWMFRAIIKDSEEQKLRLELNKHFDSVRAMVDNGKLMTASLFIQDQNVFLYYENLEESIIPSELFSNVEPFLEKRPEVGTNKCWIPMNDIFHFSKPLSVDHWRRKGAVQARVALIARIKPDMLSSYIYYHYLLQEGHSTNDNKYCMIGLDENLIFYYEELPKTVENQVKQDQRITHFPHNWQDTWQELMEPHFIYWEEASENDRKLKPCEFIFGC
ncbi:hypothetical protein EHS13_23605 [Paenibacillus psychroresistens]|uniref:Uncharacterized protein n=1 Tax=Paenibacillus psychroresistens TaxID=1778678 RepID=A0A6B8RMT3_9BACL|nr:hypothetical protein [Paenibacillus psychroresistens]QGQ97661.1 hypothetical protein EHS13_23605 [Paenibacillus psychroresistens]